MQVASLFMRLDLGIVETKKTQDSWNLGCLIVEHLDSRGAGAQTPASNRNMDGLEIARLRLRSNDQGAQREERTEPRSPLPLPFTLPTLLSPFPSLLPLSSLDFITIDISRSLETRYSQPLSTTRTTSVVSHTSAELYT